MKALLAILAAALVMALPVAAQESDAASDTPPVAASSGVYPAIIEIWPLDGEYDGYYCPPDPEGDDICLGASILIQKGSLSRLIGECISRADPRLQGAVRRDVDGQYMRFRMIGGHAARRIAAGRYLAVIEPTEQGYVYVQWRAPYSGGRACFPAELMAHYGDRLGLAGAAASADGQTCVDPD